MIFRRHDAVLGWFFTAGRGSSFLLGTVVGYSGGGDWPSVHDVTFLRYRWFEERKKRGLVDR
jgi:hypothetical protein